MNSGYLFAFLETRRKSHAAKLQLWYALRLAFSWPVDFWIAALNDEKEAIGAPMEARHEDGGVDAMLRACKTELTRKKSKDAKYLPANGFDILGTREVRASCGYGYFVTAIQPVRIRMDDFGMPILKDRR